MGLDPVTALLLSGGIQAAGQFISPGGEGLAPTPGFRPRDMFPRGVAAVDDLGSVLRERAEAPITLRGATVQQPPVFSGGGLPMNIGVTGVDPAIADPSLLTSPFAVTFSPSVRGGGLGSDRGGGETSPVVPLPTGGSDGGPPDPYTRPPDVPPIGTPRPRSGTTSSLSRPALEPAAFQPFASSDDLIRSEVTRAQSALSLLGLLGRG